MFEDVFNRPRSKWPLDHLGAWSRGWCARFWEHGKGDNPFRSDQPLYRTLWLDGWQAAADALKFGLAKPVIKTKEAAA